MADKTHGTLPVVRLVNDSLLDLGRIDIRLQRLHADMDEQINRVKALYAPRIEEWQQRRGELTEKVRLVCQEGRGELLSGKRKSISLLFGEVGWRTAPASVGFLRGVTAERAAQRLRELGHENLVRTRIEPDKPVIQKALGAGEIPATDLKAAGLKIEPGSEQFYAKPDLVKVKEQDA